MIRSWIRRRRRAVCLGDMGHALLWVDPETSDLWQANGRWSLFTTEVDDSVEGAIQMLDVVHLCDLYVDPDDPTLTERGEVA